MAVTTAQYLDLGQLLADRLDTVEGLRVYSYVADTTRPPAAVIMQPEVDYTDNSGGFCRGVWLFEIGIVVSRNNDRAAQQALSRLLADIVTAVADGDDLGVEPQGALPGTVTLGGQDLPGYRLTVKVRA